MNWFKHWRINRTKERIAALEEMVPLYKAIGPLCKSCWYDELSAKLAGELAAAKVRLARLEGSKKQ